MRERKSHIWQKHKDNWYVEPAWCAERLFDSVSFFGGVHDPCCGMGTIPLAALAAGYKVTAADIKDRWDRGIHFAHDFRIARYQDDKRMFDNIVCNPPFDDINKKPWPFIEWALSHVKPDGKVALLVPFKWFGGDERTRYLETKPLAEILILTPRPSMPPGELIMRGEKPGGGKEDFAWVIFDYNVHECDECGRCDEPRIGWIHRDKDT